MKKRGCILGSIGAVLLIMLVPATNAIQVQAVKRELSISSISYELLKNMDAEELIVFVQNLVKNYPLLLTEFQHAVEEIENTPVSLKSFAQGWDFFVEKNQGSQPRSDNQSFLEKIFWKIYNYLVLRLVISTVLFFLFQSKFTLWRTMTWGIRLLRWIKVGILLGFIDPSQRPQTPTITFEQDEGNNTLTVISVDPSDVLWTNITEIGAGSCDPFPEGTVTIGDILTNCTGILVLQYIPTDEILGVFQFDKKENLL